MPSVNPKWLDPNVNLPYGSAVKVLNSSGVDIGANRLVYMSGASGARLTITAATAATNIGAHRALWVAKHAIPNGRYGVVVPWMGDVDMNTAAAAVGDPLYLGAAGTFTLTSGDRPVVVGEALTAAAAGKVLLDPQGGAAQIMKWTMAGILPDPGDAGTIDVSRSGTCSLTTGGAETRTLPIPTFLGQQVVLSFAVDGGDCVVTCPQDVAQNPGDNVMTFADAGDIIVLQSILEGAVLRWRVTGNDGVALS